MGLARKTVVFMIMSYDNGNPSTGPSGLIIFFKCHCKKTLKLSMNECEDLNSSENQQQNGGLYPPHFERGTSM